MIPHTYPSVYVTPNGPTAMVVYELPSVAGLVKWIDYIPVKWTFDDTAPINSFNTNGVILVDYRASNTGLQNWIDYIPVFQDTSGVEWIDYIPVIKTNDWINNNNLLLETGFNLLQEDSDVILLES